MAGPGRMHALGVFVAAALLLLACAISIRVELLGHLYPDAASAPSTPLALILGAEVYADGRPSPALASRVDVGIELLRLGRVRALLMSGGNGTFEVGAMRAYVARGVASDAILLDAGGERTFASCRQARDAFAARRLTIVSQELHTARAVPAGASASTLMAWSRRSSPTTASDLSGARAFRPRLRVARGEPQHTPRSSGKRERPSAEAEGRSSGGRTVVSP